MHTQANSRQDAKNAKEYFGLFVPADGSTP